LKGKKTKNTI